MPGMVKVGKAQSANRPELSRLETDVMDIVWDLGECSLSGPHAAPARLSTSAVAGVLMLSVVTLSIGRTFADYSEKPAETARAPDNSSTDETLPLDPPMNGGKANTPSPSTGRVGLGPAQVARSDNAATAAQLPK